MYAAALFGGAYTVIYMVDVLNISLNGTTYIAASVGSRSASNESISVAIALCIGTWTLFSLGAEFASAKGHSVDGLEPAPPPREFRSAAFLLLAAIFGGAVFTKIISVGIAETLELRQAVFSDSFLILLGYFVLPVLVSLGIARAVQMRGPRAFGLWLVLIGLLLVTALMGSRSGLFLGAVIPVLALFWKKIAASRKSIGRDIQRIVLICSLVAIPVIGGSAYLASTRGLVENVSALNGTDISQADVLVDLISSEAGGVAGGTTYLASLTSFVPRAVWPDKPLPGNVISSQILTPERYFFTGAETTAGLLGEAFMNFGIGAPLFSALLMLLLLSVCSRFLRAKDDIVWMIGVILLIRGLNLLRGDMTNVVVPAISAILVWWLVWRKVKSDDSQGRYSLQKSSYKL
jgi:hypothetical protein